MNVREILVYNYDPRVSRSDRLLGKDWQKLDKRIPKSHKFDGQMTDVIWKKYTLSIVNVDHAHAKATQISVSDHYLQSLNYVLDKWRSLHPWNFEETPEDYRVNIPNTVANY